MKPFALLLDRLLYTPSRNAKISLLVSYFRETPNPDRGWALAALTGELKLPTCKAASVRQLVSQRVDASLFAWSYDYVGDLAETTALIWPSSSASEAWPTLSTVVNTLEGTSKTQALNCVAKWLDRLDATGRWALLKLLTGGLRVGVSARLAKIAVASYGGVRTTEIEEVWHGLHAPYVDLFDWLDGTGPRPEIEKKAVFRSPMLAHPIADHELPQIEPATFFAEWKWDGIRVQVSSRCGIKRLYSRSGDDISATFPELLGPVRFEGVLDGELFIFRDGKIRPFSELQLRLNRKQVTTSLQNQYPAMIRLYDILFDGGEDLRDLPFEERRNRLETFIAREKCPGLDISEQVPFVDIDDLALLRERSRENGTEGLMLKHRRAPYVAGRPKGLWYKWKREPLNVDAVLMYAQRGHGRRSSFYSDYTFGVWREDGDLVPVGKAYFGFSDDELAQIDKWVREHTVKKYGPVREVERGLVFEVAFDGLQRSPRHKSGVAMRFPRISRIRWDKQAGDADRLATLEAWLEDRSGLQR